MTDTARETVGGRRAGIRVASGLTQEQLCATADVSRPALSRAENGQPVDEMTLRKLAQALGVAARDYFEPEGYGIAVAPVPAEARP